MPWNPETQRMENKEGKPTPYPKAPSENYTYYNPETAEPAAQQPAETQITESQAAIKTVLEKQGKQVNVDSSGNLVAFSGNNKSFIDKYGNTITAPSTATIRGDLLDVQGEAQAMRNARTNRQVKWVEQARKQEETKQIQTVQTPQPQIKNTYSEAKLTPLQKFEMGAGSYVSKNEGTVQGILAGSGYAAYRYGKGVVGGFTSFFKPQTYKDTFYDITHPKETREKLYGLGQQISEDPGTFFEIAGSFKGMGYAQKSINIGLSSFRKPIIKTNSGEIIKTQELPDGTTVTNAVGGYKVQVGRKVFNVQTAGKEVDVLINEGQSTSLGAFKYKSGSVVGQGLTQGVKQIREGSVFSVDKFRSAASVGNKVKYQFGVSATKAEGLVEGEGLNTYFSKGISSIYKEKTGKLSNLNKDFYTKFSTAEALAKGKPNSFRAGLIKEIAKSESSTVSQAKFEEVTSKSVFKESSNARASEINTGDGNTKLILKQASEGSVVSQMQTGAKQIAKTRYMSEALQQPARPIILGLPKYQKPVIQEINKPIQQLTMQNQRVIQTAKPMQRTYPVSKVNTTIYSKQATTSMPVMGNISKDIQKSISISRADQSSKIDTILKQNTLQEQQQRQEQKQEQQQKQETVFKYNFKSRVAPYIKLELTSFKVPDLDTPKRNFSFSNSAYNLFLKKGKSFVQIGSGLTRGEALRKGSSETMRTLRATFKIEQAGTTTRKDSGFNINPMIFKESRTVKGKEVFTPGTFIQKKGTRLGSLTERREIQTARFNHFANMRLV